MISGHLLIRDGIRLTFPFREAIESLKPLCDEIVVVDGESTDGTGDVLREMAGADGRLRVLEAPWEMPRERHERLSRLTNVGLDACGGEWQMQLQADEILHEDCVGPLQEAIASGMADGFMIRRWNFIGSMHYVIPLGAPGAMCSNKVIRVGRRSRCRSVGDAESLGVRGTVRDISDRVGIFHYGMVRSPGDFIRKAYDMHGWFWGGEYKDKRIPLMMAEGNFQYSAFRQPANLERFEGTHPKVVQAWLAKQEIEDAFS